MSESHFFYQFRHQTYHPPKDIITFSHFNFRLNIIFFVTYFYLRDLFLEETTKKKDNFFLVHPPHHSK